MSRRGPCTFEGSAVEVELRGSGPASLVEKEPFSAGKVTLSGAQIEGAGRTIVLDHPELLWPVRPNHAGQHFVVTYKAGPPIEVIVAEGGGDKGDFRGLLADAPGCAGARCEVVWFPGTQGKHIRLEHDGARPVKLAGKLPQGKAVLEEIVLHGAGAFSGSGGSSPPTRTPRPRVSMRNSWSVRPPLANRKLPSRCSLPSAHASVPRLDGLTVLIGDNGSGKSTVIEVLELLRKAAGADDFLGALNQAHGGLPLCFTCCPSRERPAWQGGRDTACAGDARVGDGRRNRLRGLGVLVTVPLGERQEQRLGAGLGLRLGADHAAGDPVHVGLERVEQGVELLADRDELGRHGLRRVDHLAVVGVGRVHVVQDKPAAQEPEVGVELLVGDDLQLGIGDGAFLFDGEAQEVEPAFREEPLEQGAGHVAVRVAFGQTGQGLEPVPEEGESVVFGAVGVTHRGLRLERLGGLGQGRDVGLDVVERQHQVVGELLRRDHRRRVRIQREDGRREGGRVGDPRRGGCDEQRAERGRGHRVKLR